MAGKSFYRCTVCGDIHYGASAPEVCPTCRKENVYVAASVDEARKAMGL